MSNNGARPRGILQIIWFDHQLGVGMATTGAELMHYLQTGQSDRLERVRLTQKAVRRAHLGGVGPGDIIDAVIEESHGHAKVAEIVSHQKADLPALPFNGVVRSFSAERGFGFVRSAAADPVMDDVYFSAGLVAGAPFDIVPGLAVEGFAGRRSNGLFAMSLTFLRETLAPRPELDFQSRV